VETLEWDSITGGDATGALRVGAAAMLGTAGMGGKALVAGAVIGTALSA